MKSQYALSNVGKNSFLPFPDPVLDGAVLKDAGWLLPSNSLITASAIALALIEQKTYIDVRLIRKHI